MASIQFVVHPLPGIVLTNHIAELTNHMLPGTQEQLADKLKSVAEKLNKYGLQGMWSLLFMNFK